jgi:MinD superfamily P-loop ATPase
MKEITVLSGKGGTGKTSITAALASVAESTVFCDNDVDAPDLHLIFNPDIKETNTFYSSWSMTIDTDKCSSCGVCTDLCRFGAIHYNDDKGYLINGFKCEGCRLCERVCKQNAISSERNGNNHWYVSDTRFGKLIHATMQPGEDNSGKLVSQVRKSAREVANQIKAQYIINDGPPGIGCAAISSVTGADAVLIVTEPTQSGLHDIKRLTKLVRTFNTELYVLINKYDINTEVADNIKDYLVEENIELICEIPYNRVMVESVVAGKTIIEYLPNDYISDKIRRVWEVIKQ